MRVTSGVLALAVSACGHGAHQARQEGSPALPAIDILYPAAGTVFDRTCASFLARSDVTPELIKAAAASRPRLESEWLRHGARYLAAALEEIGAPYPYAEVEAVLTVCAVPTMSTPLIINVRPYLPGAEHPSTEEDFSEALFHELMHHYVARLAMSSRLKQKYAAEPLLVLNHLHVIALEKLVLSKLRETKELSAVEQQYRTSPSPAYRRAWEIVSVEGAEPFLRELKEAAEKQ